MPRTIKILFLALALAALPLRGMAAVALWHCAQGENGSTAVLANDHVDGHARAEPSQPSGYHPLSLGESSSATASSGDGHLVATCSACSACCMGGAVALTAWLPFSFAPIGAGRIAFDEPHFIGFVPAQLDRPPHARLL